MSEWFELWFGQEYLELYPHRDAAEAAQATRLLVERGVVRPGWRVLDLACGAGRHATALLSAGARVVGLDLSRPLLNVARQRASDARLVRGDVRALPLRSGSFDAVVNLFTSFGYFEDEAQDQAMLREVARVLKPGGLFALDFLNAPNVRATLVPRDERTVGSRTMVQERRLDQNGRFVVKTILLPGEGKRFIERVRLYELADFERLMGRAQLKLEQALGDYQGGAYGPATPRLLLLASRP